MINYTPGIILIYHGQYISPFFDDMSRYYMIPKENNSWSSYHNDLQSDSSNPNYEKAKKVEFFFKLCKPEQCKNIRSKIQYETLLFILDHYGNDRLLNIGFTHILNDIDKIYSSLQISQSASDSPLMTRLISRIRNKNEHILTIDMHPITSQGNDPDIPIEEIGQNIYSIILSCIEETKKPDSKITKIIFITGKGIHSKRPYSINQATILEYGYKKNYQPKIESLNKGIISYRIKD